MADQAPLRPIRAADLPSLPTDHLPVELKNMVAEVSRTVDVDVSMPCMMATTMLASLYQSRIEVSVSPGHSEPLCIYSSVLANPGERKTSTLNAIVGIIRKASTTLHHYWRSEQAVRERKIVAAKELVQELLENNESADPNNPALQRAIKDSSMVSGLKQFVLEDMTPAAFIQALSISPTALILSDEGEVWKKLSGSGTSDDIGLWLRAHTGETYVKNRKTQENVYIERPVASVLLAMQPGIIRGCANIRGLSDQGLVARFLWCVAKSRIGHRTMGVAIPNAEVATAFNRWGERVVKLIADHQTRTTGGDYRGTTTIPLSPEAQAIWVQWAAFIEYELRDRVREFPEVNLLPEHVQASIGLGSAGEYKRINASASKSAGATARIAGASAADRIFSSNALNPTPRVVSGAEMTAAVSFMHAQMEHCKAVRALMDGEDSEDQFAIINHFTDAGWPTTCKKGWLIQVAKDVCQNRDSAEAAIGHLVERGYFHIVSTTEYRSNSHLLVAQASTESPAESHGEAPLFQPA